MRVTVQQIENIILFGIIRDSGANNSLRPLVAVCITSSVVRKRAQHVPLPLTIMTTIISTKYSIPSPPGDVPQVNRSYGVHCSFRNARNTCLRWSCMLVRGRARLFVVVRLLDRPAWGRVLPNK